MDIPVRGRAFRSDSDTVDRTELLITITPSVIRTKNEARRVTDDYSGRIEGLTELRRAMEARRSGTRRRSTSGSAGGDVDGTPCRPAWPRGSLIQAVRVPDLTALPKVVN